MNVSLLKRPEVLTLIVAVLVSALAASGVAAKAGVAIPEDAIGQVVAVFWAVFVGAVFEGKFKGADYAGGLKQLAASKKFRLALVTLAGYVLNAALQPFGYALPDETLATAGDFALAAIVGMAGLDGYAASR